MTDASTSTSLAHELTNIPDFAAEETERLGKEYADLQREVAAALEEARTLPKTVEDEETASRFTATISRLRDLDDNVEGVRVKEGLPYLRRTTALNSFFNNLREKLARRDRKDRNQKPGAADILDMRLHEYNEHRRVAEQQRRDEEARIARAAEEKAVSERRAAEQAKLDAEERARRVRKPENVEAAKKEASEAEAVAVAARNIEEGARAERQDAEMASRAKPADLVRERHESALNTMKRVLHVEMTDSMKLDAKELWPFVADVAKEKALRQWAKIKQGRQQMDGAVIEFRNETVVVRR